MDGLISGGGLKTEGGFKVGFYGSFLLEYWNGLGFYKEQPM